MQHSRVTLEKQKVRRARRRSSSLHRKRGSGQNWVSALFLQRCQLSHPPYQEQSEKHTERCQRSHVQSLTGFGIAGNPHPIELCQSIGHIAPSSEKCIRANT